MEMNATATLEAEADALPLAASAEGRSSETDYYQGGGTLAAPSLFNTTSPYLNSPFFREFYASIGLKRNGPDVPATYTIPMLSRALAETVDFADYARLMEREKRTNPVFAEWLAKRSDIAFRAEDLVGSAPGTLGHMIWEFLTRTGYEIELQMKGIVPPTDIDYLNKRRGNTHDISHLVTGFGANFAGECALLWCDLTAAANFFSPELAHYVNFGQSIVVTAQMNQVCAHYPRAYPVMLEASRLGLAAGQALDRPLMMQPWEDYLDWQVDALAAHLGIVRGPGQEAWDWTNEATWG